VADMHGLRLKSHLCSFHQLVALDGWISSSGAARQTFWRVPHVRQWLPKRMNSTFSAIGILLGSGK
jgi:hypothetical protein